MVFLKKGVYMGKDLKGKELGVGLNQRKDKRYQARFTKQNGQRIEKNFQKVSEAKAWLNEQRYLDTIFITGDMTVNEWYEYWIINFKQGIVADNTTKNYQKRYLYSIKKEIGNMQLKEVKQLHCQKILNDMFEIGYAYGTIELTKITLHALFKGAVENNYLLKNPADGLKLKSFRLPITEEQRVLTRTEQRDFVNHISNHMYANVFLLILETGLRSGEVIGLQWKDIDFENKYLRVERVIAHDTNKGGFYYGQVKSKQSKRKIPLTNEAVRILNSQKELQDNLRANFDKSSKSWDGLIFTTAKGTPISPSTLRSAMTRTIKEINIDRSFNSTNNKYEEFKHAYLHSLRHTFATRCIENGMQPKTLQQILGHSTLGVTMDLYVHVTDEQSKIEIEKMNVPL